jgi:hypothetical protein
VTEAAPRAFALSFQADYVCRSTAACCTAPWSIAVDAARERGLQRAIDSGRLQPPGARNGSPWCVSREHAPGGGHIAILARSRDDACVFLHRDSGSRCAVQGACGHDALPEACQQFPRITLADERGLHVTLSHYCPTVAALTFTDPGERVTIVTPPAQFARAPLAAGLDARGHWPPLLRPGVLCSLAAWSRWEGFVVGALGNAASDPFSILDRIAAAAERLRAWRPAVGDLDAYAEEVLSHAESGPARSPAACNRVDPPAEWACAWSAVPRDRAVAPSIRTGPAEFDACLAWACDEVVQHRRPVGRYLAARAFASWCAYQGSGLRSHVSSLRTSLGVLVVELARGRAGEATPAQAPVVDAFRRADWLLLHLADSAPLARRWAASDRG